MPGVKGRSGRQPRWHENALEEATNLTFIAAGRLIRNEDVPLIDRVRVCLPLALKRIPDKHEVIAITLNASESDLKSLIDLANHNINKRNNLEQYKTHEVLVKSPSEKLSINSTSDNVLDNTQNP